MEKARKLRAMLEEDVVEPEIVVKRPQSALTIARFKTSCPIGRRCQGKAQDCADIDLSCGRPSSCCGQGETQDCADVDLIPSSWLLLYVREIKAQGCTSCSSPKEKQEEEKVRQSRSENVGEGNEQTL